MPASVTRYQPIHRAPTHVLPVHGAQSARVPESTTDLLLLSVVAEGLNTTAKPCGGPMSLRSRPSCTTKVPRPCSSTPNVPPLSDEFGYMIVNSYVMPSASAGIRVTSSAPS